jgi:L-ornithine N5-monooxygenase
MPSNLQLLAIGLGPANLALAVALEELQPAFAQHCLFVEQYADTRWHRHMLIPGVQSQVSFLKDLVSLRNPRSRFSFINYLFEQGRLNDFVNLATFTPYREEISRYLQWVAQHLERVTIQYSRTCTRLRPVYQGATVTQWEAEFDDGSTQRAPQVVVGVGRPPFIPDEFATLPEDRLVHTSRFLAGAAGLNANHDQTIVVIGGAQSAAEAFRALHDQLPQARLYLVMRSIGLLSYENSKFVNELYYPEFVDTFHRCSAENRQHILTQMHRTNYAGVAPGLLEDLYRNEYLQRLSGQRRSHILAMTDVLEARMDGDRVRLTLQDRRDEATQVLYCDRVVLGTGYQPGLPALVQELLTALEVEQTSINRAYRLELPRHVQAKLYLQGVNESTHGISDSLLSVLAHRSLELTNDLICPTDRIVDPSPQLALA